MSLHLYHLGLDAKTNHGKFNFAPVCLTTGSKGRTWAIGQHLKNVQWWGLDVPVGEDRGLLCCTGKYKGRLVSCFSSGMGGPSFFITIREAVMAGARVFIRVGSGGAISHEMQLGQVVIGKEAYLWDAASALTLPYHKMRGALRALMTRDYFSKNLVLEANTVIKDVLLNEAVKVAGDDTFVGTEFSTADFWTEQSRKNLFGKAPKHLERRFIQAAATVRNSYFSMELGPGLAWCLEEGGGLPMGAITTIYAARAHSEKAQHASDERAIQIALNAAVRLYNEPQMRPYIKRELPKYSL